MLLASRSATRARMLNAAGVPFQAIDVELDERSLEQPFHGDASELALALAQTKALAAPAGTSLVLGSDQTLELDDVRLLHKAADAREAAAQLRAMSGRRHRLHAAAVLVENGAVLWRGVESVTMHMRPLSDAFIADYLAAEWETVRWSVGCYHLEGRGAQLFDRVEGSHFAVLGLPLLPLLAELRELGFLTS